MSTSPSRPFVALDFAGAATTSSSSSSSPAASNFLQSIGHGYTIAVALGVLVLLSILLLVSYSCWWRSRYPPRDPDHHHHHQHQHGRAAPRSDGVALPRIIFVAEDDDDGGAGGGWSSTPGLDPAAISSYPKFPFSAEAKGGGGESVCPICLCEYREAEMLRMMPECRHYFHLTCIDAWLRLNASCPVCRTSPMPTPLSTPLSELVPLSHYPAGRRRG